jgi:hypothetical protein
VCVGAQALTGASYLHWLAIAARAQSPGSSEHELRGQVLAFLISADWVSAEAGLMKIRVSEAEIRRSYYHQRAQAFHKRRELRAFLRQTGETVADLLLRVKLNLLSQRIQKHVLDGHHGSQGRQRALARWVSSFKSRWKAQTYCATEYAIPECGHVQGML